MRRWGIDPAFDHRTFDIVTFDDSQLRAVVAHTPRPMFYLVHRGSGPGTLGAAPTSDSAYTDMKPDQGPASPPAPTEPTAWPPVHAHTSLPDPALDAALDHGASRPDLLARQRRHWAPRRVSRS